MSDTSVSSVAGDADTPNSSDNEALPDNVKKAISTFLNSDSDCGSSDGRRTPPPKKKIGRLPIDTIRDAGSPSEKTETEISAEDARDMASENSRGSGFSQSDDEIRHRPNAARPNVRSESDNDDACSDVSARSRKSVKDVKLCKKPSYSERKSGYDSKKLLHGNKSTTSDTKSCHSGQSRGSGKKSQPDGSIRKTHQPDLSVRNDRKSFNDVGRQLSGNEKSFREKVKAGVQDRRTPSEVRGAKSVNVRHASSEDSRMSVLSANSAFSSSCRGKVADTLSVASRSRSSSDERSSPCDSTSSHDLKKLQRKDDLKTSSNNERKSRPDVVTSRHANKSRASVDDRSRETSHNHDKMSHSSQSKSRDSGLDFTEKKLHDREKGPPCSALKQPPGREKSTKKDNVVTKTSKTTGMKTGSAARKTAETDMSADDFLSETSRTSELWAGFALGDWGHGRTADRPSIASKSDVDEVSSHCGSAASIEKLPTKERRKLSNAEAKSSHGGKKSHRSDDSRDSDNRKLVHGDKSHVTDKKKKSNDTSSDRSQLGSKSINSSRKQSPPEPKQQSVKIESSPNAGALQKSPRGISFFSGTKTALTSTYKTPTVKIPSKPVVTAPRVQDTTPSVFTKVKINGFRVFVDKSLRTDRRLWQRVDVSLVNCDHIVAARLAKQREISARKKEDIFSSVSASFSRDKQKMLQKGKRENENDAGKTLVSKPTHSKDRRQSDNHVRKKSFDKTQSEGSGGSKQSNNRKSSKDLNKKITDRSTSPSESRSPENSVSRFPPSSNVHHEKKSHVSRKSLHESKSQNSIKLKRESESDSSNESLERESNQSVKSQHDSVSNQSVKSQHDSISNKSSKSQHDSVSNQSIKSQRDSVSNKSSKSQHDSVSNQSIKSQRDSVSNQSIKSQRESASNKISKSLRDGESSQSGKSQREKESNSSSKSQWESESNKNVKSQNERESNQSGKSQHEKKSSSSSKSQLERESNQNSKSQSERESNQNSKSQSERESNQTSKSQSERESNQTSKSHQGSKVQREKDSNQTSKPQSEKKSNQTSKSQSEKESNQISKSQSEKESNQISKSQIEKKSNQISKLPPERKADQGSKSQSESLSNHRSKSQHDSKSQQSGKSHSKIKSGDVNRANHDSKSSSHESKSLSRPVPTNSNELRKTSSVSSLNKELKVKESKSLSGIRTEDSLSGKSNQDSKKKTTADINTTAKQSKATKNRIIVFHSDTEEDDSTIDSKETIVKKEHHLLNEDPEPTCDSSTPKQIVADDLDLLSKDESGKDGVLPGEERHQNAGERKTEDTTEERPDVTDGSSSRHDDKVETADVKRASSDTDSASVKNDSNDASTAGLTKNLVNELEVESAKELSAPSSDSPLQRCKSEDDFEIDLDDVEKEPGSEICPDLTKPEDVEESSICQTTRESDMSDGKNIDLNLQVKDKPVDDLEVSKASGMSELDKTASDGCGKDSVTEGQDSRGGGDCATPRERQSSISENVPVTAFERASSVASTEPVTKVPGGEPVTKVPGGEPVTRVPGGEPVTKVCVKVPVVFRSYNVEQAKKDIRLQPFVKLKVLDALVLKKLLADWEYSVRKKSQDAAAGKAVSNVALDDSASHSRSSSCTSSSGKSEIKDRFVDKNLPPARDKEVQEKKKRAISSADDVNTGEPPIRRQKIEGDAKTEQQSNSERKKETTSAAPLPETIAKSLQKAKAEFKRKGGFPSDMVRDGDVKKRKKEKDADKAVPTNMEDWMHGGGGGGRDKKNINSLSFVIPKVKSGQKPEKVKKKKAPERSEKVWLPPPVAIPVPRTTPRPAPPPKTLTLTEEDKGRSVLAKLEDTTGESENLRWQTNDSGYRGKGVVRASNWQPISSVEDRGKRFGGQEGTQWRNCSPGMIPPRDAISGSTGFPRFQRWSTPGSSSSNMGNPRNPVGAPFSSGLNAPRLPAPSRWQGPQHPIPTVITNLKAGSSSSSSENWVRLYNRDPLRLEDPSAADECSAAFSPPTVADDEDDDDDGIPNDRDLENTPRKLLADDSDNMVESVKVLAEAIQEVLVEGTISSGRRDKLVDIYAKLQRNLNLTNPDPTQGNASFLNAFYSSTDQTLMSVDMFKDLLQQGSTPSSQPENPAGNLPSSSSATNEIARGDFALTARDLDLREGIRVAMGGYQDVDHRRMDGRGNPMRGFEQMMLSAGTPSSSLPSPRGPPVIGKSDAASYGSLLLPLATTGGAPGGSALLHRDRGFRIDPNATFMDIDERNKCSKDIDERNAWMRTTAEREPVKVVPDNLGALLQTSCDDSTVVSKPDSLRSNAPSNFDARQTVSADDNRTLETPTVSGSPGIKALEKTEAVVVVVPKSKEVLRQEAVASRIEDELALLEMLVTIQCELGEVSPAPECSSETTVAADGADPAQVLNTSDTVPSGVSSVVSSSPVCGATVRSVAGEDESQDSATQLSGKDTPQQKADDEQKAAANAKTIEDRVISLARNALKPFYHKSLITSEEFKLIMRKTIAKIKVREGEELKESKIPQLINAYVESIIHRRKKSTL